MIDNDLPTVASRRVPIAILIGLTALSGIVHGTLDGRWSTPTNLQAQGSRLDLLPDSFGEWELVETQELNTQAAQILRCYGSSNRVYRHRVDGAVINVALLFGPRGPIAVHTPEICYDSVGTRQLTQRRVETLSTVQNQHQLWSVPFARQTPGSDFEVWYAWSDGSAWRAAEHPRFWLTDTLYKIQLAGPAGEGTYRPCQEFLEAFLPQVEKVLQ